jgi:hypothetical protein
MKVSIAQSIERIYSLVRTIVIVGGSAVLVGGFYAFVIAGLCRIAFKLEENTALLWIGVPLFVMITIWALIYLPKHLRKAGFI